MIGGKSIIFTLNREFNTNIPEIGYIHSFLDYLALAPYPIKKAVN